MCFSSIEIKFEPFDSEDDLENDDKNGDGDNVAPVSTAIGEAAKFEPVAWRKGFFVSGTFAVSGRCNSCRSRSG